MSLKQLLQFGLASTAAAFCKSQSQPNTIANQYPDAATGTINGTVAILPIPYSVARSFIPAEYPILKNAYQSLLPDFPKDMYPLLLQTELDHDVKMDVIPAGDFQRASLTWPFVDRLNDGYTSMMYGETILMTAANVLAIGGTDVYGFVSTPARFDPPCDAYVDVEGSDNNATSFKAYPLLGSQPAIQYEVSEVNESPYPLHFWKNVTNQPQFSKNKLVCDHYVRLFNTTVTQAPYDIKNVRGDVNVVAPYYVETKTWSNVYGLQLDNSFIERNYVSCESLRGITFDG